MFSSFVHDRSGAVALIFGLAFIPLVVGVGAAIDYSRASSVHAHLQEIADAAALAGARENSGDIAAVKAAAQQYYEANLPPALKAQVKRFDVSFSGDNAVRVEIDGSVETTLTNVVGIRNMDVDVAAEVMRGVKGSLEVALVLDNTGSMAGAKLRSLKDVSTKLIDDVTSNEDLDAKFALIPFAEYVNVGASSVNANWLDKSKLKNPNKWRGCVGSRSHPLNVRDEDYGANKIPALQDVKCGMPITPLTDSFSSMKIAIDSMAANDCTYVPAGLMWGWRALSPNGPFAEGDSYDAENKDPRKVIVLLTDGANTLKPSFPYHVEPRGGCAQRNLSVPESNTYLSEGCRNAKAENIEVFTIAFEVDDKEIKKILQGCASGDTNYFDASSSEELAAAFQQMTASFQDIRISR